MAKNLLNAAQIKNLAPKAGTKLTKYHDGEGLYLWVYDDGKKSYKRWFFRYRFQGVNKPELLIGSFPNVKAAEARKMADEMREQIKAGINPAESRKAQKQAQKTAAGNSFEAIAREWWAVKMADKSESHRKRVLISLEKDVFPFIGSKAVSEITPPEVLEVARRIESRNARETCHRVIGRCSEVFLYAIVTGRAQVDPAHSVKKALKPVITTHMAAVTEPERVGEILKMIDGYQGTFIVKSALSLAPLIFVRPGELRQAEWKDFNLDAAEWSFEASKTKQPHIVPLSRQALEILRELHLVTGNGRYVFPAPTSKDRPMSNNAILAAYRRMGLTTDELTCHGWRATARTLLDEKLNFDVPVIEMQLAHAVKDVHGRAYNRTTFIEARTKMMQAWADYLDKLKSTNPR